MASDALNFDSLVAAIERTHSALAEQASKAVNLSLTLRNCCSDGSKAMAAAARKMKIAHRPVNLSAGIRVIAGVYHVQNVNAYDSRLKDWLRRFKGVATQYLDSYLGWYRAIDRTPGGSLIPASLLAMAVRV